MEYHLIGCNHDDPEGGDRVKRALDQIQPDLITLEWYGHEAHPLRRTIEFQRALALYDRIARAAVAKCGFNLDAYDESNRRAAAWGKEVRGTLDWAESHNRIVVPTEEPTQGEDFDRRLLNDPEGEAALFVNWIRAMKARREVYDPLEFFPPFDDSNYDLFEAHLSGESHAAMNEEVDRYKANGVLNQWRYDFESNVVRTVLNCVSSRTRLVHVGGAYHLVDAGALPPSTLFQTIRREFPDLPIIRHSLRQF